MNHRKKIEITLDRLTGHPRPKVWLEQYTIPSRTAAEMLAIASNVRGDITNKSVIDLGCGTGRLAIGARLLGANEVTAVDIDPISVQIARENAKSLQIRNSISWVNSDIEAIRGSFDTVLMNPPFGTKSEHADRKFLLKALSIADVTYSLHKRSTRLYLLKLIKKNFGSVEALYEIELSIPRIYNFHRRRNYNVEVDLYIVRSNLIDRPN